MAVDARGRACRRQGWIRRAHRDVSQHPSPADQPRHRTLADAPQGSEQQVAGPGVDVPGGPGGRLCCDQVLRPLAVETPTIRFRLGPAGPDRPNCMMTGGATAPACAAGRANGVSRRQTRRGGESLQRPGGPRWRAERAVPRAAGCRRPHRRHRPAAPGLRRHRPHSLVGQRPSTTGDEL